METFISSSTRPGNQETRHKNGELTRISQDSSRIHLLTLSGRSIHFMLRTGLDLCGVYSSSISTSHSYSTSSLKTRRRRWLNIGDIDLERFQKRIWDQTRIEDSQLTERRIMSDTLISIKYEGTRDCLWSGTIGGAETRTLESISRWERDMELSHHYPDFTTKRSSPTFNREIWRLQQSALAGLQLEETCSHYEDALAASSLH
jgi:hypothetical protein